jgi:hypothetical protein
MLESIPDGKNMGWGFGKLEVICQNQKGRDSFYLRERLPLGSSLHGYEL